MSAAHLIKVVGRSFGHTVSRDRIFVDLQHKEKDYLSRSLLTLSCPKGSILISEGQEPRGVFWVESGRVKLSSGSAEGKSVIMRIVRPGECFGLEETVSGKPYEVTAAVIERANVCFLTRTELLGFVRRNPGMGLRIAETLSDTYHTLFMEVRSLGLPSTSVARFAKFLLQVTPAEGMNSEGASAIGEFTQEEIGEIIGVTRETVSRLIADFRRRDLLEGKGRTMRLVNRHSLESLACTLIGNRITNAVVSSMPG